MKARAASATSNRRPNHKPPDRRYQRTEKAIRSALNHTICQRRINVRVRELCIRAKITPPTFYLHSPNSDSALKSYETEIIRAFTSLLPKVQPSREMIFLFLLNFIHHHHTYFRATLLNYNSWVLAQLLKRLRPLLTHAQISDKYYDIYIGHLISLISCWGKHERFATAKIPIYAKKLVQVRIMDIGL